MKNLTALILILIPGLASVSAHAACETFSARTFEGEAAKALVTALAYAQFSSSDDGHKITYATIPSLYCEEGLAYGDEIPRGYCTPNPSDMGLANYFNLAFEKMGVLDDAGMSHNRYTVKNLSCVVDQDLAATTDGGKYRCTLTAQWQDQCN